MQRIFMLCVRVFGNLYSNVVAINVSTQSEPWRVRKNKFSDTYNALLLKKKIHIFSYRISAQLVTNK